MLLEPDRFRHTPPIAPERSHGPPRPANTIDKRGSDAPPTDERDTKPPPDKS